MLLDIGLSLIYLVVLADFFGIPITTSVIIITLIFSLIPDIDSFVELYHRGKLGGKESGFHRELTHYPILYIPVIFVIFIFFGWFWTTLFSINILSHFIHDSLWTGWGLKWLWPFSKRNYKFFANKRGFVSLNPIVSWSKNDLKATMRKYGDENWFKNYYLRLSPLLIVEIVGFITGLLVLYLNI